MFCRSWLSSRKTESAVTCVIPGTRNPKHVVDNLVAMAGSPPDAALRKRMTEHYNSL